MKNVVFYCKVKWFLLRDKFLAIFYGFFFSWRFLAAELLFTICYLFLNPYRMAKRFYGEDEEFCYGETPISSWKKMARECGIGKGATLLDLGAGRGRGSFWLTSFTGCSVIALEKIPLFVKIANFIKKVTKSHLLFFEEGDIFITSLPRASHYYLYGTTFSKESIEKLLKNFSKIEKGAFFLTVSFALSDYDTTDSYQIQKTISLSFPWGDTLLYLEKKCR